MYNEKSLAILCATDAVNVDQGFFLGGGGLNCWRNAVLENPDLSWAFVGPETRLSSG